MRNVNDYLRVSLKLSTQPSGKDELSSFEIVHWALSDYRDQLAEMMSTWRFEDEQGDESIYEGHRQTIEQINELLDTLTGLLVYADRVRAQAPQIDEPQ